MATKEETRQIQLKDGLGAGTYGMGRLSVNGEPGKTITLPRSHARIFVGSGKFDYVALPDVPADGFDIPADFPQRAALVERKFDSMEKLKDATDEQILDINGIGEATLKTIRAALK